MSSAPASYQAFISRMVAQPQPSGLDYAELLQETGAWQAIQHVSGMAAYVLDYNRRAYALLNGAIRQVLGHPQQAYQEGGLPFMIHHWHDFPTFNQHMFPQELAFLSHHADLPLSHIRFTKSYRYRTQQGQLHTVVQRNTHLGSVEQSAPVASFGVVWDITPLTEPGRLIHQIEQFDPATGEWVLCHNRVYYPDVAPECLLSQRELEILKWVVEGLTSQQIACKLYLSVYTVNTHRRNMLQKTNSTNTPDLLRYAIQHKLF